MSRRLLTLALLFPLATCTGPTTPPTQEQRDGATAEARPDEWELTEPLLQELVDDWRTLHSAVLAEPRPWEPMSVGTLDEVCRTTSGPQHERCLDLLLPALARTAAVAEANSILRRGFSTTTNLHLEQLPQPLRNAIAELESASPPDDVFVAIALRAYAEERPWVDPQVLERNSYAKAMNKEPLRSFREKWAAVDCTIGLTGDRVTRNLRNQLCEVGTSAHAEIGDKLLTITVKRSIEILMRQNLRKPENARLAFEQSVLFKPVLDWVEMTGDPLSIVAYKNADQTLAMVQQGSETIYPLSLADLYTLEDLEPGN